MTSSDHEPTYGHSTAWKPERPRLRLFPLLVRGSPRASP